MMAITLKQAEQQGWAQHIRGDVDLRAMRRGCYIDLAATQRVRDFIENYCYRSPGHPIQLFDWQWERVVLPVFGWMNPDGTRRFSTAFVFVPKKNGKSLLISAIGLYGLLGDGEQDPQVFNCAYDREQAGIVYRAAAEMVDHSPELSRLLRCIDSTKRIITRRGTPVTDRRMMRALSREVHAADGHDASMVICDEIHRWRDAEMWKVLRYAGAARSQPLRLVITTAGVDHNSLCHQLYEYGKKVNTCKVDDDSFYALIYEPQEGDDWEDESTWQAVNPSYGGVLNPREFKQDYQRAKSMPSEERNFKRLRLNMWVEEWDDPWIEDAKWTACTGERSVQQLREHLVGHECWCGMDLAARQDLTAFVMAFPVEDKIYILPHFWLPREGLDKKASVDGVPYRRWVEQGYLELCDGDCIDPNQIYDRIIELSQIYTIRQIAADKAFTAGLDTRLMDYGFEYFEFRQTRGMYTPAVKHLEGVILNKYIVHGGHPILGWNVKNVTMDEDNAGKIMPSKRKSTGRIDGVVASCMAMGGVMMRGSQPDWDDIEIVVM